MTEGQPTLLSAPDGLWMTWRGDAANGWSPKQVALLDAIMALSVCTDGPSDTLTTEEAAKAVGCSVDEAWHALVGTEYAEGYVPNARSRSLWNRRDWDELDDVPNSDRPTVRWALPEADEDDEDDEWYGRRIELAEKLGQPHAAQWWREELALAQEDA